MLRKIKNYSCNHREHLPQTPHPSQLPTPRDTQSCTERPVVSKLEPSRRDAIRHTKSETSFPARYEIRDTKYKPNPPPPVRAIQISSLPRSEDRKGQIVLNIEGNSDAKPSQVENLTCSRAVTTIVANDLVTKNIGACATTAQAPVNHCSSDVSLRPDYGQSTTSSHASSSRA